MNQKTFFTWLISLMFSMHHFLVGEIVLSFEEECNAPCFMHALALPPNSANEFVLFTMPKTGTHLMQPLLQQLSGRAPVWAGNVFSNAYEVKDLNARNEMFSGSWNVPIHWFCSPVPKPLFVSKLRGLQGNSKYLSAHAPYSTEMESLLLSQKCIAFFVLRDPRDYVVSLLDHINKHDNVFIIDEWFYSLNFDEQIHYIITGTAWYNSAVTIVKEFIKWKDSPACCAVRFEKLIGPQGDSCTKEEQIAELRKIANALNIQITDAQLLNAFKTSYGQGYTFNKGQVGRWKQYFNEANKKIFKELLGNELIELGYEKDYDW